MARSVLFVTALVLQLLSTSIGSADPTETARFSAHLSGDEQIPVPVDTIAQGDIVFRLSEDRSVLHYTLSVTDIENVYMAHIHLAVSSKNGPVIVWLYPRSAPPLTLPGALDGVLTAGVIRETDLAGPLAGDELEDLIEAFEDGKAYVNVHTSAFPCGEIRGQIR